MPHKTLAKSICSLCCVYFLQINITYAQEQNLMAPPDTLRLELKQAEKMFLDNNLQLLAEHYNIQSGQALVAQARKWDNPVLNTDQNVYANNHFFQHGTDANGNAQGEVYAQVQQLIKTAGKRGRQTDLARTNVNLAEWQFKSVLRNLRATLIKDYYTVAQLQGNAQLYDENMQQLTKLLNAQEQELNAGNIAKKEYLRVNALIVSLQQDITDNSRDLNDAQNELKTVLGVTGNKFIQPVAADSESAEIPFTGIMQLVDTAKQNNTDCQQEVYQLQYNRQNLRLQKALSVPDLTIGPEFDQAANYAPNYFGLAISLPIPLWDRNHGNIKSAQYQVKQEESLLTFADQKLQNDVLNSYQKLLYTAKMSSNNNSSFYREYYHLQKNIIESYNRRQISLIEFLEYYNDYKDIREKQLQQILNLRLAKEDLNDIVGTDIIK
jgi:outer membrane protein, heavy metal efflux system